MYNPVIVIAILVQIIVTKFSRKAAAVIGYVITTGILLWGISAYANGHQISLFGITVSEPIFLVACLVWYGFDTIEFLGVNKPQLPKVIQSVQQAVPSGDNNIAVTINWKGLYVAYDFVVQIWLDGVLAGSGPFVKGFNLQLYTTEGVHNISLNKKGSSPNITINVEKNKNCRIDLDCNRFGDKFKLTYSETNEQFEDITPEARQLLTEAQNAYEKGVKLENVLHNCDLAIQNAPHSANAHNLRGIVLDDLGRTTEAIQEYREAVRLNPAFEEAKTNLAKAEGKL